MGDRKEFFNLREHSEEMFSLKWQILTEFSNTSVYKL